MVYLLKRAELLYGGNGRVRRFLMGQALTGEPSEVCPAAGNQAKLLPDAVSACSITAPSWAAAGNQAKLLPDAAGS